MVEISSFSRAQMPAQPLIPLPESKVVDIPGTGIGDSAVKIREDRSAAVVGVSGAREIDEAELRRDEEIDKLVSAALSYPAPPPPAISSD